MTKQPSAPDVEDRADSSGHSRRSLDRALFSGLAWTGTARWSAQAVTWAITLILARLLSESDFGLWTSAGVYIGIVTLLSEFGIGASVVMLRNLTTRQIAQINGLSVGFGVAAMMVSWLLAVPIAGFYRTPEIAPVIGAVSVMFLIASFRIVPASLLQRDLQFRFLAVADAAKSILGAIILVSAAAAGLGYWTFPIGAVATEVIWTAMVLRARRHPFAFPRLSEIRHAVSFSTDVILSRVSWYGYSNADFAVAGRRFSQAMVGNYGMAWNIASVPVDKINSIIISVMPAFFSAVQDRKDELRRYVVNLTGIISLASFPAGVGLALVAPDFVPVVLGEKWVGAIAPIQVLALYAAIRSIGPILAPVLNAVGETRWVMWNNFLGLLILPAAFIAGSRWGIAGVAAGWMVAHPVILFQFYRRVAQRIELRTSEYAASLRPAVTGVLAMTVAVLAVSRLMGDMHSAVRLVGQIGVGAAVYFGVVFTLFRERFETAIRIIRRRGDRATIAQDTAEALQQKDGPSAAREDDSPTGSNQSDMTPRGGADERD